MEYLNSSAMNYLFYGRIFQEIIIAYNLSNLTRVVELFVSRLCHSRHNFNVNRDKRNSLTESMAVIVMRLYRFTNDRNGSRTKSTSGKQFGHDCVLIVLIIST